MQEKVLVLDIDGTLTNSKKEIKFMNKDPFGAFFCYD